MKIILSVLLAGLLCVMAMSPAASNTPGLIETEYALIWGFGDAEIPEYLTENFDRLFRKLASFFEIDIPKEKKILVWVVPHGKLQQLYYNEEKPDPRKNIAALYDKKLNRLYFTPWHINEYYVTWGLVAYFMDATDADEYSETMISALARRLIWQELAKELMDEGAGKL